MTLSNYIYTRTLKNLPYVAIAVGSGYLFNQWYTGDLFNRIKYFKSHFYTNNCVVEEKLEDNDHNDTVDDEKSVPYIDNDVVLDSIKYFDGMSVSDYLKICNDIDESKTKLYSIVKYSKQFDDETGMLLYKIGVQIVDTIFEMNNYNVDVIAESGFSKEIEEVFGRRIDGFRPDENITLDMYINHDVIHYGLNGISEYNEIKFNADWYGYKMITQSHKQQSKGDGMIPLGKINIYYRLKYLIFYFLIKENVISIDKEQTYSSNHPFCIVYSMFFDFKKNQKPSVIYLKNHKMSRLGEQKDPLCETATIDEKNTHESLSETKIIGNKEKELYFFDLSEPHVPNILSKEEKIPKNSRYEYEYPKERKQEKIKNDTPLGSDLGIDLSE